MSVPNLERATGDEVPASTFNAQEAPVQAGTQLIGCYLCLMEGNAEQPDVIFHYAGTTYCMDHLYKHLQGEQ